MKFKALLTIDLPNVDEPKRKLFYEKLKELHWIKIDILTTAWKCEFKEGIIKSVAHDWIISSIKTAKEHSKITKVHYAFQIGEDEIEIA